MLTLVGPTAISDRAGSALRLGEYELRPCSLDDIPRLGWLYFHAYDPGVACATLLEATADIEASFAGEYGPLWTEGSLAASSPSGEVVAAVLVVTQAPWDDSPSCPFIIELFTARSHRRRGLGQQLMTASMGIAARLGHDRMALRVMSNNVSARALYANLGFHEAAARRSGPTSSG